MTENNFIIIKNNIMHDLRNIFNHNFKDSIRGYIPIVIYIVAKIYKKWLLRNIIKNNYAVPKFMIDRNKIIKVKPVLNSELKSELKFKHIPTFQFLENFSKKVENTDTTTLQQGEYLSIKLAGLESINKEGINFLNKLFHNEKNSYELQFNNIQYNDTPEIYCWLFVKMKIFPFYKKNLNLNIILVQNGFSKVNVVKTEDVYDEKIFYYTTDQIDAETDAKIKGKGVWNKTKSTFVSNYAHEKGSFHHMKKRLVEIFKAKSWQKIILRK
jgi:hypothetical protein